MDAIKAVLKKVHPVIERGNFKSQKVWVTTHDNPEYPQTIEIELQQAKCGSMDGISIGAPLTLHLNLRGREWTGTDGVTKVFNSLVCWKVEANGTAPAAVDPLKQEAKPVEDTSSLPF